MRRFRIVLLAVFLAGGLTLMQPSGSVHAAAPQAAAPQAATHLAVSTTPQLDDKGHEMKGLYLVIAVLTSANGQPVNDASVAFFEQATFMADARAVTLGTAKTDGSGTAAVAFQPTQAEPYTLVAKYGGDTQYVASEGETSLQVQAADLVATFPQQPAPLAPVQHWLVVIVEIFVLLFWIFLVWLFLWAVLGIWLTARRPVTEPGGKRAVAG